MDHLTESLIAALHRERDHYLRRGLSERAEQVDAELARLSGKPQDTADRRPRGAGQVVQRRAT